MAVQPETLGSYDDRHLVAAFQDGDQDAFARIVAIYYPSLVAQAQRRLHSRSDAEDAVQETLLRAYRALHRFGGEYRLRAWLGRILANSCNDIQAWRSGEVRVSERLVTRHMNALPADEQLEDADTRLKVREALNALPGPHRTAFVLRELENLSYSQVAKELSVTEPNARARVHRARVALRRSLHSLSGTLGGIAIPWRLFVTRRTSGKLPAGSTPGHRVHEPVRDLGRLALRALTSMAPGAPSTSASPVTASAGTHTPLPELLQSPAQSVSQGPLSTLAQGSVSQVSQALAQAAASPVSQAVLVAASDAGHTSLPVAGMLATLVAAGAATLGSGLSGMPAAQISATPAAATTSQLHTDASYQGPPDAGASSSASTSNSVAPASSASSGTSASGTGAAHVTAPGGSDAWDWVGDAASGASGAPSGGTSGSTSPTSASDPGGSSTSSTTGGPTPSAQTSVPSSQTQTIYPCPYLSSFTGSGDGQILLPAPEPSGTTPSAYFVSGALPLDVPGSAFVVSGPGTLQGDGGTVALDALYGACLADTTSPALVANLSDPADLGVGELQLRGALVSSQTTAGETATYYRGTAAWLSGPNASATPLVFAAEVLVEEPANTSSLMIAFFGNAPEFSANPTGSGGSTPASAGAPTSTTSSAAAPSSSGSGSSSSGSTTSGSGQPVPPTLQSGSPTTGSPGSGPATPGSSSATGQSSPTDSPQPAGVNASDAPSTPVSAAGDSSANATGGGTDG